MTIGAERLPAVPDLVVIGAYKCGTTTLQHLLEQHPEVHVAAKKEPNYWAFAGMADAELTRHPSSEWSVRSSAEYAQLFAGARQGQITAEVSPEYLKSSVALRHLAERSTPSTRLVAILRDPCERAFSDFMMYRRDGVEPFDDFHRALDEQETRRKAGLAIGDYVETGRFAAQLEPWLEAFGDRLLVLLQDDLRSDAASVASRLYAAAGVDPDVEPESLTPQNRSGVPDGAALRAAYRIRTRWGPRLREVVPASAKRFVDERLQRRLTRVEMPSDVRARLVDTFRPDVERLAVLIDRDLSDWLTVDDA